MRNVKENSLAVLYVNERAPELVKSVGTKNGRMQVVENSSRVLNEIRRYTDHDVHLMECCDALIVCEDGTDAPVAKLDGNGNLECYLNGFGGLVEGRG